MKEIIFIKRIIGFMPGSINGKMSLTYISGDIDQLGIHLNKLISYNELRNSILKNALEFITGFNNDSFVQKLLNVFRRKSGY